MIDQVILGNCTDIMPSIDKESIDLILTDPPFYITKEVLYRRRSNPMKYKKISSMKDLEEFDNYGSETSYWNFTNIWIEQAVKLLKPGGHILVFFDRFKIETLYNTLRGLGLTARQPLFWIITNPVPTSWAKSFLQTVSEIAWATKKPLKQATFNKLGFHHDYIMTPIVGGKKRYDHPTQKPVEIGYWLIDYLTKSNDLVLDPFCGTGTFLVAANNRDRRFIGIDNKEKYIDIARNRIKSEVLQTKLTGV